MTSAINSPIKAVALGLLLVLNVLTALVTVPLVFMAVQPREDPTSSSSTGLTLAVVDKSLYGKGKEPSSKTRSKSVRKYRPTSPANLKELWREIEEESFQDPVIRKLLNRENSKDSTIEIDQKTTLINKTNAQSRILKSRKKEGVLSEKTVNQSKLFRGSKVLNYGNVDNNLDFEFIIDLKGFCDKNTYLLIVVCSSIHHFDLRESIRNTWGSFAQKLKLGIKVLFMLGLPQEKYKYLQPSIIQESRKYGDLVQASFIDHYANLSLKSIAAIKWTRDWCKGIHFFMKTDDDIFVNIPNLLQLLEEVRQQIQERFILGYIIENAVPIKDRYSKWYSPDTVFRNRTYPSYASGSSYVISSDLIADLYKSALESNLFWLEDVYITGMLSKQLGATLIHNKRFTYRRAKLNFCHYFNCITGHEITAVEMQKIWSDIHLGASNCAQNFT